MALVESLSPQLIGKSSTIRCRFCQLDPINPIERTVMVDRAGFVVPSVGSLVGGWVLVVPHRHVLSLAELNPAEWIAFSDLQEDARSLVESTYGECVMFEHGSGGSGRAAGCGVDHAHMHIVPVQIDLRQAVRDLGGEFSIFEWATNVGQPRTASQQDYIFISDETGEWITYGTMLPSQVIRRAIAISLGEEVWDWKSDHHRERMSDTILRLTTSYQ